MKKYTRLGMTAVSMAFLSIAAPSAALAASDDDSKSERTASVRPAGDLADNAGDAADVAAPAPAVDTEPDVAPPDVDVAPPDVAPEPPDIDPAPAAPAPEPPGFGPIGVGDVFGGPVVDPAPLIIPIGVADAFGGDPSAFVDTLDEPLLDDDDFEDYIDDFNPLDAVP
jgi:hypothetical protein